MMNKALQVWSPMLSELNRFHWDVDELFDRWFGGRMANGTGNGVLNPPSNPSWRMASWSFASTCPASSRKMLRLW